MSNTPSTIIHRPNAPAFDQRIEYLDAFRGIAIVAVILYHAFRRWNGIEPFEQLPILSDHIGGFGSAGVILFFCLSGYVILLTLDRTAGYGRFLAGRWLRLFPGMLLASIFIYATGQLIPERPLGTPRLIDAIPGLIFISPNTVGDWLGQEINSLDGAFWSIYVEVKFYIAAGLFYFVFRDRNFHVVFSLFAIHFVLLLLFQYTNIAEFTSFDGGQNPSRYTWFLVGIGTYLYHRDATKFSAIRFYLIAIAGLIQTIFLEPNVSAAVMVGGFIALAFFPVLRGSVVNKFTLYFGFISYPLYLIHQNFVTGMSIKLYNWQPSPPVWLYPTLMLIVVIIVADAIARLEPRLRRVFRRKPKTV